MASKVAGTHNLVFMPRRLYYLHILKRCRVRFALRLVPNEKCLSVLESRVKVSHGSLIGLPLCGTLGNLVIEHLGVFYCLDTEVNSLVLIGMTAPEKESFRIVACSRVTKLRKQILEPRSVLFKPLDAEDPNARSRSDGIAGECVVVSLEEEYH